MIRSRSDLLRVHRMVVKIGSSLLADAETGVRQALVERFADEIAALHAEGMEIVVVSSGAVALGCDARFPSMRNRLLRPLASLC